MAQTEPQRIPAGQLAQAVAPPAYDSLQADLQKPQLPPMTTTAPQQVPEQQLQQGVPFQAWPQDQINQYPPTVLGSFPQKGPVQYIAAPPVGGPGYQFPMIAIAPQPPYEAPHDFLFLAMVTTSICAILNLISLTFGIPAIILSAISFNAKGNKDYPKAKKYGKYSLTMTILNILFTLCMALLITGLMVGCYTRFYYGYTNDAC